MADALGEEAPPPPPEPAAQPVLKKPAAACKAVAKGKAAPKPTIKMAAPKSAIKKAPPKTAFKAAPKTVIKKAAPKTAIHKAAPKIVAKKQASMKKTTLAFNTVKKPPAATSATRALKRPTASPPETAPEEENGDQAEDIELADGPNAQNRDRMKMRKFNEIFDDLPEPIKAEWNAVSSKKDGNKRTAQTDIVNRTIIKQGNKYTVVSQHDPWYKQLLARQHSKYMDKFSAGKL